MKKTLILFIFLLSCSKDVGTCIDINLLTDKVWTPQNVDLDIWATIEFKSNGDYLQEGIKEGIWIFDDCVLKITIEGVTMTMTVSKLTKYELITSFNGLLEKTYK